VFSGIIEPDFYTDTTMDFVHGPVTLTDVQIDHVLAIYDAW
jgi:hypothetical protein